MTDDTDLTDPTDDDTGDTQLGVPADQPEPEAEPATHESAASANLTPQPATPREGDLPVTGFRQGKHHRGQRTNFHSYILSSVTRTATRRAAPRDETKVWNGILCARFRWAEAAQKIRRAAIYDSCDSTWNTRINCRPLTVSVVPHSWACGMIRICPFCYSRKAWQMFEACCKAIQFGPRLGISHRAMTVVVRRHRYTYSTVADLEAAALSVMQDVAKGRNRGTIVENAKSLKGYFRSVRFWFTKTKAGQYQLHVEIFTLLTTVSQHVAVPPTLLLTSNMEPVCKTKDGVVYENMWTSREIHRSKFRSWFARVLRYRPEWLTADDELLLAYNRVLQQVKISQYSRSGEFQQTESS